VADNVAAVLGHGKPRAFRYKTRGVFVDMGRNKAVVSTPVVRFRGFPAWFAARTYHMLMMPGLARKVRLVVDWTVGLLFGRASAELGMLGHPQPLDAPQPAEATEHEA
jgi:NADH dehydrogenase